MSKVVKFHTNLLGDDPTPEQKRLYEAFPRFHGYSNDQQAEDLLIATLVLGLYLTRDPETETFRTVPFAVTKPVEAWCLTIVQNTVYKIQDFRKKLGKTKASNKPIVEAFKHLEMGSRVFSFGAEPAHWVCFGFKIGSPMPEWVEKGLLL